MIEKVYYWKNGNGKLIPIIEGDRKCGKEIDISKFHQIETNCNGFINQIRMKINNGLKLCEGFNLNVLQNLCNNREIYYV